MYQASYASSGCHVVVRMLEMKPEAAAARRTSLQLHLDAGPKSFRKLPKRFRGKYRIKKRHSLRLHLTRCRLSSDSSWLNASNCV